MLTPKRTKYRKAMKGRNNGVAGSCNYVAYGTYGLQSLEAERVTSRQLEAARQAMSRYVKRGGKIWIRVFPHLPVTKKPLDVKMGGGKGALEYFAAKVKPGTVMFEMAEVSEEIAREALRLASHKLPVKTRFIIRHSEVHVTEEDL